MPQDIILRAEPDKQQIIGENHATFIIAEIGQNHQGDIQLAKNLIQYAKCAGADCVKFQKTSLPHRFTPDALQRPYTSVNSFGATYGEHRAHLEFTEEQFLDLQRYANSINILFSSSAMDEHSLQFLSTLGLPFIKIGSGDANNFPLLAKAAQLCVPLIISTGMQEFATVKRIYHTIKAHHDRFVLMHCVSSYPTKQKDLHLRVIDTYRRTFPDVHIGYSGHEEGCVAEYAVAAGAKVIERHLTLNTTMQGSDHACSLTPMAFREMVDKIRQVECILGVAEKSILECELPCREKLGKSLVAARSLESGHVITEDDIMIKVARHPGIPAEDCNNFFGKRLMEDIDADEAFELEHFQF